MYFLTAAMAALGAVGAWWLRDRPLPGETGRFGFTPKVRRRWYIAFAIFFAAGAVAQLVMGLVDIFG